METDLAKLIPKMFVQRRDAKAIQHSDGSWEPVREGTKQNPGPNIPWKMGDFRAHISGDKTFGNYLIGDDSKVKLFVLDIDLEKVGTWVEWPDLSLQSSDRFFQDGGDAEFVAATTVHPSTPRQDWLDRRHPGRGWYKLQLRSMGELLRDAIRDELDIQVAMSYSGGKGIHVYGFTGEMEASSARAGALLALEAAGNKYHTEGEFVPFRGKNFFQYSNTDPLDNFKNLSIEVFPKQDDTREGGYGNLVRLPLGINRKNPRDPCFFLDPEAPITQITPHPDPAGYLNRGK